MIHKIAITISVFALVCVGALALHDLGESKHFHRHKDKNNFLANVDMIDTNQDTAIDRAELAEFADHLFDSWDKNQDEFLEADEIPFRLLKRGLVSRTESATSSQ